MTTERDTLSESTVAIPLDDQKKEEKKKREKKRWILIMPANNLSVGALSPVNHKGLY